MDTDKSCLNGYGRASKTKKGNTVGNRRRSARNDRATSSTGQQASSTGASDADADTGGKHYVVPASFQLDVSSSEPESFYDSSDDDDELDGKSDLHADNGAHQLRSLSDPSLQADFPDQSGDPRTNEDSPKHDDVPSAPIDTPKHDEVLNGPIDSAKHDDVPNVPVAARKRTSDTHDANDRGKKPKIDGSGTKKNVVSSQPMSPADRPTVDSSIKNELTLVRVMISELNADIKKYVDLKFCKVEQLIAHLQEQVTDIRTLVDLTMTDNRKKKNSVKSSDTEAPFFNIVFSEDILQVIVQKCMVGHIISTSSERRTEGKNSNSKGRNSNRDLLARATGAAIRVMFFVVNLRRGESRSLYRTPIGKKFSEFREGIVLTALNAAKKNRFNLFRTSDTVDVDMKVTKPKMPIWLCNDVVTNDHVTIARIKTEEVTETGKSCEIKGSSFPKEEAAMEGSDSEFAIETCVGIYQRCTQKLKAARTCAKAGFFDDVGYLFVNWKTYGCHSDQSSMRIRWRDNNQRSHNISLVDIPDTILRYTSGQESVNDEDQLAAINRKNKSMLLDLMDKCPDMDLQIEHEVYIRKHAKKSSKKSESAVVDDGDNYQESDQSMSESMSDSVKSFDQGLDETDFDRKDTLVRNISLIDISCRLLSCYSSQLLHATPASFLCSSSESLRSIFAVATVLKKLFEKVIHSYKTHGIDEVKLLDEKNVNGLTLRQLMPAPARQKSGLRTRCVHMFQPLFASKCSSTNPTPRPRNEMPQNAADSSRTPDRNSDRRTTVIEIN